MKQTSSLTRKMAATQEAHVARGPKPKTQTYRIYVGVNDVAGITSLLAYNALDATVYHARGSFAGAMEHATVVERIGATLADTLELARNLRTRYAQFSVLVTAHDTRVWSVE